MSYHDVGVSLEYEEWNNQMRSPTTCVVMVKVSYVQGLSKVGTTLRWWRNNDVTRALIEVHKAQESNQCVAQRDVQKDMYKCISVWDARMCLSTFASRWYIEYQYKY